MMEIGPSLSWFAGKQIAGIVADPSFPGWLSPLKFNPLASNDPSMLQSRHHSYLLTCLVCLLHAEIRRVCVFLRVDYPYLVLRVPIAGWISAKCDKDASERESFCSLPAHANSASISESYPVGRSSYSQAVKKVTQVWAVQQPVAIAHVVLVSHRSRPTS